MIVFEDVLAKTGNFTLNVGSLKLEAPGVMAVTGQNGAGKTVFLKTIIGFTKLEKGKIYVNNIPNNKRGWQEDTGVYFDDFQLIPYLTPEEYFYFIIKIKKLTKETSLKLVSRLSEKLNLSEEKKYIRELSKGTQKKVGLISSLLTNPSLVIWDEPFSNLDEASVEGLNNIVKEYFRPHEQKLLLYATNTEVGHYTERLKIEEEKLAGSFVKRI